MQTVKRKKPSPEVRAYLDLRKELRLLLPHAFHIGPSPETVSFTATLGEKVLVDRLIIAVRSCKTLALRVGRHGSTTRLTATEHKLIERCRSLTELLNAMPAYQAFEKLPHTTIK
jgi:hypothetical protein